MNTIPCKYPCCGTFWSTSTVAPSREHLCCGTWSKLKYLCYDTHQSTSIVGTFKVPLWWYPSPSDISLFWYPSQCFCSCTFYSISVVVHSKISVMWYSLKYPFLWFALLCTPLHWYLLKYLCCGILQNIYALCCGYPPKYCLVFLTNKMKDTTWKVGSPAFTSSTWNAQSKLEITKLDTTKCRIQWGKI